MKKDIDIRLLDMYIEGEISADEVLFTDGTQPNMSELDAAIKNYKDVIIHIEAVGLKNELEKMHRGTFPIKSKQIWLPILAAAAIIITIVAFTFLFVRSNQAPQFEDYFTHFDQLIISRGNTERVYENAIQAYSSKNYLDALDWFKKIPEDSMTTELKFYAGVSALGSEHLKEAANYFESIGIGAENKFNEQTRWYLALCYWQNKEETKAVLLLETISKNDFKYKDAQKLIAKLKNK
jgi:hypothetical protein